MSENEIDDVTSQQPLINYRNHLIKVMEGNTDRFEKQLSYISAGSLGVSMAFIKDIVGSLKTAHSTGWLLWGWVAMGATLLINLISQAYANYCHSETIDDIDSKRYNNPIASRRHRKIELLNYISIGLLTTGIGFLLYFVHLNLS